MTATEVAAGTATAKAASPTESPTSPPTSTSAEGGALFGPESGSLKHDTSENFVHTFEAGVSVRDFIAQARFYNPFSRDLNSWDYGFFFRYIEDGGHYRLVVRSSRRWSLLYNTGSGDSNQVREGVLSNLNIDANGYNDIKLVCLGDQCEFYLNDSLIATLDVSQHVEAGDIYVGTGFYTGNEVTGKETRFEDFTIWSNP